ncbi:flagellar hook-associated protein FlgL [Mixta calida]|uniref:flagellar hook-associated protein FlgL n=1 Tax=Mixta calida TaxID=665913 RepID=UPI000535FAF2|nr:flagellar hook-associated protein FlgL [Mixta calida]AIX74135.1 flagellar hook protein FlgL [Pantoea sp. PSNIH2]POU51530.1 flagellar hook-filament junction protein FlgL [Pantoea sp. PSNIH5]POU62897.1 flagellar hook-filament junction protein FlgL [Pantoea sp. PSNIH4]POY69505.1 flagellar hook-filament junction protein FlgL [Pantoea sp. PSNIH3]HCW47668.1 flagellar hook-filament junction protein FlgL [Erwiniaceae bacterium]
MRLSTNMMFDQQMRGVSNAQSSWLKAGEQLSTGKRVVNPSDDPLAAAQAVVLSQAQAENSQYKLARNFASQSVSLEESTLQNVTLAVQSAQSAVISAGNGALSDDDRASYATQLEGIRSQLLNLANSTDGNGRYIFAGYKSDSAPFTEDANGRIVYNGGTDAITQKVDASRTMTTSHTGAQVFMSLTSNAVKEPNNGVSESNIFNTLDTAINALKQPIQNADDATKAVSKDALDKATRGLSNSLNNILAVRSELGTQLDELDKLDSLGADRSTLQATRMSGLVDVDYTKAISTYTMQQQALQASYKTFSDMSQMSLFQMNR